MEKGFINVNDRKYQEKKKWAQLSRTQERWIMAEARRFYDGIMKETNMPLTKQEKRKLLHTVFHKIRSKGIRIPFSEIGRVLSSRIRKWNRRVRAKQTAQVDDSCPETVVKTV